VSGGTFNRIDEPNHPATISNFRLDRFEVTVGRWRLFKQAWDGGYRPAAAAGKHTHLNGGSGLTNSAASGYESGWDVSWASNVDLSDGARQVGSMYATWTAMPGANEQRPIVSVNWFEAYAFCIWDGGFLPSAAELNYAAAGGGDAQGHRLYPWSTPSSSDTIDCSYANYLGGSGATFCYGTYTTDVGSLSAKGDGRFGQSDLAGNVWEWAIDWYNHPPSNPCNDCAYLPASASERVVRGGAFEGTALYLQSSYQGRYPASTREIYLGVRCARRP
jgi:formylglycine-generating enzyme required for sulfatase activity